ncbi:hypothetical protein [Cylindrospermopsis raciborskii]|uniref:hypothetical protein n=1 Tax=Cylindrospermopsis raciborskii TaxID=77022 RepID=UPI0011431A2B|nr:hypothetical protein [Cylindrospermopsis raciborskii]TPX27649.1 hypothetical protein FIV49_15985 [Cylindrospermopsis raciborskii GIHE 2018]
MILQTSWYIVPVVSLFVAIITVIPDLYARFKYRHTWIPVGSPPGMIGDDYHYFTLLNHLHRKLLNFLPGVTLTSVSFSANSKFQLAGYIFNLIPFHIGFLLEDRRMGVLFVRIWNRFILGIASTNLAYLIISHLGLPRTWLTAIACYLFFFVAYPGPFGIQTLQSIVFQTNNYRHIYERANANDLTRAMFAETTAPILMIGMSFLILFLDLKNPLYLLLVTVSLGFLSFHYFPSALVLALITMVICFFLVHNYAILILLGMIISIYIVLYLYLVGKDEVGKEIFAHNDSGKIIKKFGKYDILYFASIIIPYLLSNKLIQPDIIVQVIQVSLLFFLLSHFFYKHQISRFWDRAANILFQFIAATILVGLMSNNIENKFLSYI